MPYNISLSIRLVAAFTIHILIPNMQYMHEYAFPYKLIYFKALKT